MKHEKDRPTEARKDGSNDAVWLKHKGNSAVLCHAVGELPGGAVFKTSAQVAESLLTSSMYRPATEDEIEGATASGTEGAAAAPKRGKNRRK